jgi:hypothetical protein
MTLLIVVAPNVFWIHDFLNSISFVPIFFNDGYGERLECEQCLMHQESVDLLGRFGISSEKSPFSAGLPKADRSVTEGPGSKHSRMSDPETQVPPTASVQ